MQLPESLTLTNTAYWLDGGTMTILGHTETGDKCQIRLNQKVFDSYSHPGRLFFDKTLIEVRSNVEAVIIELLRSAAIQVSEPEPVASKNQISKNALILSDDIKEVIDNSPEENLRKFRDEIIAFVESDEYVALATNGLPKRK